MSMHSGSRFRVHSGYEVRGQTRNEPDELMKMVAIVPKAQLRAPLGLTGLAIIILLCILQLLAVARAAVITVDVEELLKVL